MMYVYFRSLHFLLTRQIFLLSLGEKPDFQYTRNVVM